MAWTATARCEQALLNLNFILADARRHAAALDESTSSADVERTRALAVGAMVSVCEDYCQGALSEFVETGVGSNTTGKELWDEVLGRVFVTWDAHLAMWGRWGIEVFGSTPYKEFHGLIDARNAAFHGFGALTRVQLRKEVAITNRITASGIPINAGRLQLDNQALFECRRRSAIFVRYVDVEFQGLLAKL